jgi:hypothetical protein
VRSYEGIERPAKPTPSAVGRVGRAHGDATPTFRQCLANCTISKHLAGRCALR